MDETAHPTESNQNVAPDVSLALLTDLYQLTMAFGYWKLGRSEQRSIFHLFFRAAPFAGSYAIAAGLESAIEFMQRFRFTESDIEFLAQIQGNDGNPLFNAGFLNYLSEMQLSIDIDAMPEGSVAFGHEPLLRVEGPLAQCQILETPLLNLINFQTLIATKATRIVQVAGDQPVLEFGLRRAQGVDGALSASRAAYIGGCAATSNVLAGKRYGIPVKGTHAHSWVMSFDDELESFESYADAMPNNCVFLVDTYDTLQGVRRAVTVGKRLRSRGHEMVGIRLDSGDLAALSIAARDILDRGGFPNASIVASNDLDEYAMRDLRKRGAEISVWGISTKLATAYDQPALGGVYKLGALQNSEGEWQHRVKLSEQPIKTSIPGRLQVCRFTDQGKMVSDMIVDQLDNDDLAASEAPPRGRELKTGDKMGLFSNTIHYENMLTPVFRNGVRVTDPETLDTIRNRTRESVRNLPDECTRFDSPASYPVGLEENLFLKREQMIRENQ